MSVLFTKMVPSEMFDNLKNGLESLKSQGMFNREIMELLDDEFIVNSQKAIKVCDDLILKKQFKLAAEFVCIRINYILSNNLKQIVEGDIKNYFDEDLEYWTKKLTEITFCVKFGQPILDFDSLLGYETRSQTNTYFYFNNPLYELEKLFNNDKELIGFCQLLYKGRKFDELINFIVAKLTILLYKDLEGSSNPDYLVLASNLKSLQFKEHDVDTDEWKFWYKLLVKIGDITELRTKPTKKMIDKDLKKLSKKAIPELKKKGFFSRK